jgi:hypothetical protein
MKNGIVITAAILLLCFFFFLGYQWAAKELKKEKAEWIQTERELIRKELIEKAKKNYEDYMRLNGIDSMDYNQRVEWLMSNSAYE